MSDAKILTKIVILLKITIVCKDFMFAQNGEVQEKQKWSRWK